MRQLGFSGLQLARRAPSRGTFFSFLRKEEKMYLLHKAEFFCIIDMQNQFRKICNVELFGMGIIGILLLIAFVIVCILLVCLVLLQNEEGGGLGGLLGGGSSTAFGSRSANVLTKATYILVTLFFVSSFFLALINKSPELKGLDAAASRQEQTEDSGQAWYAAEPADITVPADDETVQTEKIEDSAQTSGIIPVQTEQQIPEQSRGSVSDTTIIPDGETVSPPQQIPVNE
jgi:preprotein translocase subunit SecG